MNCKKCGAVLAANDQFCKNCGTPVNTQQNISNQGVNMNSTPNGVNYNGIGNTQPNGFNGQNNFNQMSQNNKNLMYIIIGVVIVAVIALVVVLLLKGGDNNSNNSTSDNNTSTPSQVTNTSTYKVYSGGFTFNIPDNLIYKDAGNSLLIGDAEGTWAVQLQVQEASYSQIKSKMSQLQPALQQSGIEATAFEEKSFGGVNYITSEVGASGQYGILAMAELNSMNIAYIMVMTINNDFDYSALEIIAPVISSATMDSATANMAPISGFDINQMIELTK